jgi:hypothetical protein
VENNPHLPARQLRTSSAKRKENDVIRVNVVAPMK